MIKRLFILLKLGRKLAKSEAMLIITKIEKGFSIILNAACKENDYKIIKDALGNRFNLKS